MNKPLEHYIYLLICLTTVLVYKFLQLRFSLHVYVFFTICLFTICFFHWIPYQYSRGEEKCKDREGISHLLVIEPTTSGSWVLRLISPWLYDFSLKGFKVLTSMFTIPLLRYIICFSILVDVWPADLKKKKDGRHL